MVASNPNSPIMSHLLHFRKLTNCSYPTDYTCFKWTASSRLSKKMDLIYEAQREITKKLHTTLILLFPCHCICRAMTFLSVCKEGANLTRMPCSHRCCSHQIFLVLCKLYQRSWYPSTQLHLYRLSTPGKLAQGNQTVLTSHKLVPARNSGTW